MTFPKPTFRRAAGRSRLSAYFVVPLVVALSALAACGDDPVEPVEPVIGTIRLTVGTQTVSITAASAPTLTISGASNVVSATFLDDDGAALTLDPNEFEIRLIPANTGIVTFTRTTAFTGTLNRVAAGSTQLEVQAYHKLEGHDDFSRTISITVQ